MRAGRKIGRSPALVRWLTGLSLSDRDRRYGLADLDEEYARRSERDGKLSAGLWVWGQAVRSSPQAAIRLFKGDVLSGVRRDVSLAWRMTRKTPLATAVIVLSIGVGVGAVTAVLTLASTIMFPEAASLREPQELVTVYRAEPGDAYGSLSFVDVEAMREHAASLVDVAAVTVRRVGLGEEGSARPALAEVVSGNYFELTGMALAIGRGFDSNQAAVRTAQPLAVLADHTWAALFERDPSVMGASVRVNGTPVTIVGVAPPATMSRRVPIVPDLWLPLGSPSLETERQLALLDDPEERGFFAIGRLSSSASIPSLSSELGRIAQSLDQEHREVDRAASDGTRAFTVLSERDSRVTPEVRAVVLGVAAFCLVIVGLVLFIACSNVTGMFVARAATRRKEIAVRSALGAGRGPVARMLIVEGLLPAVAGGVLGAALAGMALRAMNTIALPVGLPIRFPQSPNGTILLFGIGLGVLAGIAYSLIPAFAAARRDVVSGLREGRGAGTDRGRVRGALVLLQTAAAVVLIVGAGAFFQSMGEVADLELGFDPDRVVLTTKTVPAQVEEDDAVLPYADNLLRTVRESSAVGAAAVSTSVEATLLSATGATQVRRVGQTAEEGPPLLVGGNRVSPGYFSLMGIEVLQGRSVEVGDTRDGQPIVVINRGLADRLFPGQEAVGRSLELSRAGSAGFVEHRIVGLTNNGRFLDFDDPGVSFLWTAFAQDPTPEFAIVAKPAAGVGELEAVRALQSLVDREPGEVPFIEPGLLEDQLAIQVFHLQVASRLLAWGGAFGLFLALTGVYGIVSFAVTRRRREMAIRLALGAPRARVVGQVAWEGIRLGFWGLVLGMAVVLPSLVAARGLLMDVSPIDPLAVGGGALLVLGMTALASGLPARRVAATAPMRTLRDE